MMPHEGVDVREHCMSNLAYLLVSQFTFKISRGRGTEPVYHSSATKLCTHSMLKTTLLWDTLRTFISFLFLLPNILAAQQTVLTMPMAPRYEDGAEYRWLHKRVLGSRLLDDMQNLSSWSFAGAGEMKLVEVHASEPWTASENSASNRVMRIRSTSNIAQVDGSGEWEDLVATRKFDGEDWGKFNRISLWVYPDVVGAPAISCSLVLHNDGAHKLPDHYNEGRHESIILKNHTWNQVVWEIEPLDRDRVTALEFA